MYDSLEFYLSCVSYAVKFWCRELQRWSCWQIFLMEVIQYCSASLFCSSASDLWLQSFNIFIMQDLSRWDMFVPDAALHLKSDNFFLPLHTTLAGVILRPGFIYGTRTVGSMKIPLGVIGSPMETVHFPLLSIMRRCVLVSNQLPLCLQKVLQLYNLAGPSTCEADYPDPACGTSLYSSSQRHRCCKGGC